MSEPLAKLHLSQNPRFCPTEASFARGSSKKNGIIISLSSDIGLALAKSWREKGWKVFGTYRTLSSELAHAQKTYGFFTTPCDLLDLASIKNASEALIKAAADWDVLILGPGSLEPIGNFEKISFDAWEESMHINLIQQLRIVHALLPYRKKDRHPPPTVLFFAGGGTNNAVLNYSSYTLSKIALIKMTELLDAEIPDTRFVIVGPGCVETKIHEQTLRLGEEVLGDHYINTLRRLREGKCTPMEQVVACCNWLIETSCNAVSGRNFSVVSDAWGQEDLEKKLSQDSNMYKLRRDKNDWRSKEAAFANRS